MSKYRKFYVALATFLAVLVQVVSDSVITAEEVGILATALVGALGVFGVANRFPVPQVVVDVSGQAKAQVDAAAPIFVDGPSTLEDGLTTFDGVPKMTLQERKERARVE